MTIKYVNRINDDEIILLIQSILNHGNMKVETMNEAILVKLMALRGTRIHYSESFRNIEEDFIRWKNESGIEDGKECQF